jgi:lysophospholipase L1-like esterase
MFYIKNLKPTIRALVLVSIFVCILFSLSSSYRNSGEEPDPDPNRFAQEISHFETWDGKNSFPAHAVLFVGSSSIRLWMTHEFFPELTVINRGFGGAHISDVIHFASQTILRYRPKLIVFYCGDNDIAAGKNPDQVLNDLKSLVDLIAKNLEKTQLIYISIKPSLSRWEFWAKMEETNKLISEYSKINESVHYLDIAQPMLEEDGKPNAHLFIEDGLHLNENGYELWNKLLSEYLENNFKDLETD